MGEKELGSPQLFVGDKPIVKEGNEIDTSGWVNEDSGHHLSLTFEVSSCLLVRMMARNEARYLNFLIRKYTKGGRLPRKAKKEIKRLWAGRIAKFYDVRTNQVLKLMKAKKL